MHPIAKTCPTCGSRRIKLVRSDWTEEAHGKRALVPDLERQECPVCGEVLFDRSAMQRIQHAWQQQQSRRKSARTA
jgi:YgiT-type zinc finger domain-containing protein